MGNRQTRRIRDSTPLLLAITKESDKADQDLEGTAEQIEDEKTNQEDQQQPEDKKPDDNISPEMEALIRRRPGYEYFTADFDDNRGKLEIGMTLSDRGTNLVIVTELTRRGIARKKLKPLDRILAVSDVPVYDKLSAERLLACSLGMFSFTIERPLTAEARKEFKDDNAPTTTTLLGAIRNKLLKVKLGEKGTAADADPEEGHKPNNNISPEMEALMWRGPGYEYFTVDFFYDQESNKRKPLGLELGDSRGRVIVRELDPGGRAIEKGVQVLDRILAVNDELVVGSAIHAKLHIDRLSRQFFNLTIERPLADEARKSFQEFDEKEVNNSPIKRQPLTLYSLPPYEPP